MYVCMQTVICSRYLSSGCLHFVTYIFCIFLLLFVLHHKHTFTAILSCCIVAVVKRMKVFSCCGNSRSFCHWKAVGSDVKLADMHAVNRCSLTTTCLEWTSSTLMRWSSVVLYHTTPRLTPASPLTSLVALHCYISTVTAEILSLDGNLKFTFICREVEHMVYKTAACGVSKYFKETFGLTLWSAVASDGYISKCSVPSRSNLHF